MWPDRPPLSLWLAAELIEKLEANENTDFYLSKILRAHILPLTNCAFNKSGDKSVHGHAGPCLPSLTLLCACRFITGSYDRTCKVWSTATGEELLTLEGHRNVVYAIAFNNPFGCVLRAHRPRACVADLLGVCSDKVVTGSFDKTAKVRAAHRSSSSSSAPAYVQRARPLQLWDAETGACQFTFRGHETEIVCLSFDPSGGIVATGSMDNTAKLWDVRSGEMVHDLTVRLPPARAATFCSPLMPHAPLAGSLRRDCQPELQHARQPADHRLLRSHREGVGCAGGKVRPAAGAAVPARQPTAARRCAARLPQVPAHACWPHGRD